MQTLTTMKLLRTVVLTALVVGFFHPALAYDARQDGFQGVQYPHPHTHLQESS